MKRMILGYLAFLMLAMSVGYLLPTLGFPPIQGMIVSALWGAAIGNYWGRNFTIEGSLRV